METVMGNIKGGKVVCCLIHALRQHAIMSAPSSAFGHQASGGSLQSADQNAKKKWEEKKPKRGTQFEPLASVNWKDVTKIKELCDAHGTGTTIAFRVVQAVGPEPVRQGTSWHYKVVLCDGDTPQDRIIAHGWGEAPAHKYAALLKHDKCYVMHGFKLQQVGEKSKAFNGNIAHPYQINLQDFYGSATVQPIAEGSDDVQRLPSRTAFLPDRIEKILTLGKNLYLSYVGVVVSVGELRAGQNGRPPRRLIYLTDPGQKFLAGDDPKAEPVPMKIGLTMFGKAAEDAQAYQPSDVLALVDVQRSDWCGVSLQATNMTRIEHYAFPTTAEQAQQSLPEALELWQWLGDVDINNQLKPVERAAAIQAYLLNQNAENVTKIRGEGGGAADEGFQSFTEKRPRPKESYEERDRKVQQQHYETDEWEWGYWDYCYEMEVAQIINEIYG